MWHSRPRLCSVREQKHSPGAPGLCHIIPGIRYCADADGDVVGAFCVIAGGGHWKGPGLKRCMRK
jgi:hypothetical protein